MMDDCVGRETFYLGAGAAAVPISWGFEACSSETANDGFLPYGSTIDSVELTVADSLGTDATTEMLTDGPDVSEDGLVVSAQLTQPPEVTGTGLYTITMLLTLSTGAVLPFVCRRVYCGDR